MAIKVHGTTDVTGSSASSTLTGKSVVVVGVKDSGILTAENKVFKISSVTDAGLKFGESSKAYQIAKTLLKNNVREVYCLIPTTPAGEITAASTYETALAELLRYSDIEVVVTDSIDATVHAKIKNHIDTAESQDIFRYAVVGLDSSDSSTLTTAAGVLNSKRMFMVGPQVFDTSGIVLSGIYNAAGLAAIICNETSDPALPVNGCTMLGFGGVSKVLLTAELEALAAGGVVPLYTDDDGNPAVYRLVTTYTKDINNLIDPTWKEGTTIFVTDDVLKTNIDTIKAKYKRTKNVERILKAIRTDIINNLENKQGLEIIENFDSKTVSVIKDPDDVYGALIDYEYDVVTPLYTLTIRQHMKL